MTEKKPRRLAASWLEVVRTAIAALTLLGTLYIIARQAGWL